MSDLPKLRTVCQAESVGLANSCSKTRLTAAGLPIAQHQARAAKLEPTISVGIPNLQQRLQGLRLIRVFFGDYGPSTIDPMLMASASMPRSDSAAVGPCCTAAASELPAARSAP